MFEHVMVIRVYYADTDALGVVHHANYLRYFELARTEALRAVGIELPFLLEQYGVQFAVVSAAVRYRKPAKLDNLLCLVTKLGETGKASVNYKQEIRLDSATGLLLCEAQIKLVTVDQQMRPALLPDVLLTEIRK